MIDLYDPLTGPFWQAAKEDRLVLCWCDACDRSVWYPEDKCPQCGTDVSWKTLSGRGLLYSWTSVEMPVNPDFDPTYIAALVIPSEAPEARLVTHIVNTPVESLACDMPVEVTFRDIQTKDGRSFRAPVFYGVTARE